MGVFGPDVLYGPCSLWTPGTMLERRILIGRSRTFNVRIWGMVESCYFKDVEVFGLNVLAHTAILSRARMLVSDAK